MPVRNLFTATNAAVVERTGSLEGVVRTHQNAAYPPVELEADARRAGHIDADPGRGSEPIEENLSPPHQSLKAMSHTHMFRR
jgi:hypothetical protein